jgi:hypothetical protein
MTDKLIATTREDGGKLAKTAQAKWLQTQEGFQFSQITPWEGLPEECKEEWCVIWEAIATPYLDVIRGVREGVSSFAEAIDMLSSLEVKEDIDPEREIIKYMLDNMK